MTEGQLQERVGELEALVARLMGENGRGSDEELVYVGSKTRMKFHRPGCEWARCIREHNLIEFGSHREAREAGYKPCGTCKA